VDDLDLTEEEFRQILAACRLLRIGRCTPGYLQEFLARRLEEASGTALAARIRQLSGAQMDELCDCLRREQEAEHPEPEVPPEKD
jgi:hypothetical protein